MKQLSGASISSSTSKTSSRDPRSLQIPLTIPETQTDMSSTHSVLGEIDAIEEYISNLREDEFDDRTRVIYEKCRSIQDMYQRLLQAMTAERSDIEELQDRLGELRGKNLDLNGQLHELQTVKQQTSDKLDNQKLRISLYHGDAMICDAQSMDTLENVDSSLALAMQRATVAQAQRAGHAEPSWQSPSLSTFRTMDLEPPAAWALNPRSGASEELFPMLIQQLEQLRLLQNSEVAGMHSHHEKLRVYTTIIEKKIQTYKQQISELHNLDQKLFNTKKIFDQLTGNDDLKDLTDVQLVEFSQKVNTYARKVNINLAQRQESQQAMRGCVVCIDRDWNTSLQPCGHNLCDNCAGRLNYCPTCRTAIRSRQRIQ